MSEINVLIAFATTEGHTEAVANRIAGLMRENGVTATIEKISPTTCLHEPVEYDEIIVGGSVHYDQHQKSLKHFIKKYRRLLSAHRCVFFSVSNAAASTELESQARRCMDKLFAQTNWHADVHTGVGGALKYRDYGAIKKWIMRRISEKNHLPTDTSSNHVLTDWMSVDSFFLREVDYLKSGASSLVA